MSNVCYATTPLDSYGLSMRKRKKADAIKIGYAFQKKRATRSPREAYIIYNRFVVFIANHHIQSNNYNKVSLREIWWGLHFDRLQPLFVTKPFSSVHVQNL